MRPEFHHMAKTENWRKSSAARIRMYRHGLGDCFLLTFPTSPKSSNRGRDFQVLIDCGDIRDTGKPDQNIGLVVQNLIDQLKEDETETLGNDVNDPPILDVVVATHEHWDHLSAFASFQEKFEEIQVQEVWMAWTEKPGDPIANGLRTERAAKVKQLRVGIQAVRSHLAASGALNADASAGAAADDYHRVAEVLSFFGYDSLTGNALGAAGGKRLGIVDAMNWCRNGCQPEPTDQPSTTPRFFKPEEVIDLTNFVSGLNALVLGPPTDRKQLFKDLPTKKGRETYEEEEKDEEEKKKKKVHAISQAFFGADVGLGAETSRDALKRSTPFDPKYRIQPEEAEGIDFFQDHYFGTGPDDRESWRRIDGNGLEGAAEFALRLDSDTNNTSLALAFALEDGRVLLFPGDAQVGNWESWHKDETGANRSWKVGDRTWTAAEVLKETVVYKVGHHGSHNATLRALGLELMEHKELIALVPVDRYVAHKVKRWPQMPFDPLITRLEEKTKGRVVFADEAASAELKRRFPGPLVDAEEKITVTTEAKENDERPLYVNYFLPKKSP